MAVTKISANFLAQKAIQAQLQQNTEQTSVQNYTYKNDQLYDKIALVGVILFIIFAICLIIKER